ncbi:YoaK family protein [Wenzhouxiangella marina]|uniref:Putative transmembrane protein n=1 Tax=Wenzhouxiangella marina TaxID=1579979 RepID=A0A0K0Y0D3_9GAMM|nr:YoaK family protein [Wenzhouxiangella marina]AKS43380.1 putative transmembrane protein [Wenzhouxiangella marina]MBB6088504.1 uncharacterized membrane protein YoaK (UPF0700 family) [Wenzhouxiangella marina]
MITRLPRWVEVGGFWLACIAGAANAIGLLGFEHQSVSHLTGTSTLLSLALAELDVSDSIHLLGIILAFVLGAALAGALVGGEALLLGRRYGVALLIETLLLLGAMLALLAGSTSGHYLASAACGLQNGMVSTYSGAVVRTTHVSGLFTDLGTMFGAWFRGHAFNTRRAMLYLLLILGFIIGGSIGALLFLSVGFHAMLFPAFGAAALALVYWGYWLRTRGRSEKG